MRWLDPDDAFFDRLWIRIAVPLICVAWGLFEFRGQQLFWGSLFCAAGVWSAWQLHVVRRKRK